MKRKPARLSIVIGAFAFFSLVSCQTIEASTDKTEVPAIGLERILSEVERFEVPSKQEKFALVLVKAQEEHISRIIKQKEKEAEQEKAEQEALEAEQALRHSGIYMEPHPSQSTFKTYMDWEAVTIPSSAQYQFLQTTHVGDYGIMMKNGDYVVALGSGYADYIGQRFGIEFEDGQFITVAIGDFKADQHTDSSNRMALNNNDILEFIVDTPSLAPLAARDGSFNPYFNGKIIGIYKLN